MNKALLPLGLWSRLKGECDNTLMTIPNNKYTIMLVVGSLKCAIQICCSNNKIEVYTLSSVINKNDKYAVK